ncbi:hypothetical protein JCM6882_002541 [Rhodosporidiobolus microsporus]
MLLNGSSLTARLASPFYQSVPHRLRSVSMAAHSNDRLNAVVARAAIGRKVSLQGARDFRKASLFLALKDDREGVFTASERDWAVTHVKLNDMKRGLTDFTHSTLIGWVNRLFPPDFCPLFIDPLAAQTVDEKMAKLGALIHTNPAAALALEYAWDYRMTSKRDELKFLDALKTSKEPTEEDVLQCYAEQAVSWSWDSVELSVMASAIGAALENRPAPIKFTQQEILHQLMTAREDEEEEMAKYYPYT